MSLSALEIDLRGHIDRAVASVYDVAEKTPFEPLVIPGMEGVDLWVKREDLQAIHAYKLRGAYYAIKTAITENQNLKTIVTASAGNHAQGVALSARVLGIKADIFMPLTTPQIKQNAVRLHGQDNVQIHLVGDNFDAASKAAIDFLDAARHASYIHPFDNIHTIAGQATIADEIVKSPDGAELDYLFVPIGGGGLAAGIASYMKFIDAKTKVIGVEGVDQASMTLAMKRHGPKPLKDIDGFCDGSAVKLAGDLTYRLCKNFLHSLMVVSNDEVCAAMESCFLSTSRFITEPSGAMALAGLQKKLREDPDKFFGQKLGFVCSGANVDPSKFSDALKRAAVGAHKRHYLRITIPEQQGGLLQLLDTYFSDVNVSDFQYGKIDPNTNYPVIAFDSSESSINDLMVQLEQDGIPVRDVSDAIDVRMRDFNFNPSLLNEPIMLHVNFPERKGALREFMRHVSGVANLCYFNYQYSGDDKGQAVMGFDFSAADNRREFLKRIKQKSFVSCQPLNQEIQERMLAYDGFRTTQSTEPQLA